MNTIFLRRYEPDDNKFPIRDNEVLRYSGYMGFKEPLQGEIQKIFSSVIEENKDIFQFKICYRRMPVLWENGHPIFPFDYEGEDLVKAIEGCREMILFAATVGVEIDRRIRIATYTSQTKALFLQAFGAERVETLCDYFCEEINRELCSENLCTVPRFSPGYGDLPLEIQRDFFRLLDCNRQIGVSLGDNLLMNPTKSVTAILGIKEKTGDDRSFTKEVKCLGCNKKDCEFRNLK